MENERQQEVNDAPNTPGPVREVDNILVETPSLPPARLGSPQEKTEEDEMNTVEDEKPEPKQIVRQDQYCVFKDDKELKTIEAITLKSQACNGICIKIKIINDKTLDRILFAISNAKDQGITKLRLEDTRMLSKAVASLKFFCKSATCVSSIGLQNVTFSDGGAQDFKGLVEAVAYNARITHF